MLVQDDTDFKPTEIVEEADPSLRDFTGLIGASLDVAHHESIGARFRDLSRLAQQQRVALKDAREFLPDAFRNRDFDYVSANDITKTARFDIVDRLRRHESPKARELGASLYGDISEMEAKVDSDYRAVVENMENRLQARSDTPIANFGAQLLGGLANAPRDPLTFLLAPFGIGAGVVASKVGGGVVAQVGAGAVTGGALELGANEVQMMASDERRREAGLAPMTEQERYINRWVAGLLGVGLGGFGGGVSAYWNRPALPVREAELAKGIKEETGVDVLPVREADAPDVPDVPDVPDAKFEIPEGFDTSEIEAQIKYVRTQGADEHKEMIRERNKILKGVFGKTRIPKSPMAQLVKEIGGIHPDGEIAKILKTRDITPRNSPGLFNRKTGKKDLDNIDKSGTLWENLSDADDGTGNYLDRDFVLQSLEDERAGFPNYGFDGTDNELYGDKFHSKLEEDVFRAEEDLDNALQAHFGADKSVDNSTDMEIIEAMVARQSEVFERPPDAVVPSHAPLDDFDPLGDMGDEDFARAAEMEEESAESFAHMIAEAQGAGDDALLDEMIEIDIDGENVSASLNDWQNRRDAMGEVDGVMQSCGNGGGDG